MVSGRESQRAHTGTKGCGGHTHDSLRTLVCKGMPDPALFYQANLPSAESLTRQQDSPRERTHSPGPHRRHRGSRHQHSTKPNQPPRTGIFPWLWALGTQQDNRESSVLASHLPQQLGASIKLPAQGPIHLPITFCHWSGDSEPRRLVSFTNIIGNLTHILPALGLCHIEQGQHLRIRAINPRMLEQTNDTPVSWANTEMWLYFAPM